MRLEHIVCLEYHNLFSGIFPEMFIQPPLKYDIREEFVMCFSQPRSHLVRVELSISRYPEEV